MTFPSIRLEGTILSADLLDAIERADKHGQEPRDFGFEPGTKVKDEIASTWVTAKALWTAYQSKLSHLREGSTGTTETRNLFISPLLSLLGYSPELTEAEMLNGKSYAVSHRDPTRDSLPIHITGPFAPDASISPDRSTLDLKLKGGTRMSPHALTQEYLNLTEHLYGLVTNGHKLRLLRDSSRLIKLSFLEFDFERMFGEELFSDFALLYRLLHASRMPATMQEASRSLIERYHQDALDSGSRIRDGLASAVAFAMQTIADGLLSHPENDNLRTEVETDPSHAALLHQNLLRWVYRTLFLLVIEERGLHHHPDATLRQRRIYRDYYSLQRLRRLADRPQLADRRHSDLWRSMHQTLRLYEDGGKGRPLGVEPLGSFLFREEGLQTLFQYQLDNRTLLTALYRLSIFKHPDTRNLMRVNYGALDVEEFGSIYESLLELRPRIISDGETHTFQYAQLAGNERKTTGSYYTPDSLVQQLISTALDPVLEERLEAARKEFQSASPELKTEDFKREILEKALLSLKVCDPAVGSGHFLIAAAHRLSRRLAEIRAGDEALSLDVQRHALRDVVSHCLYGVDINPLSVELCKVSLWMLAMEPGKPLSFLDHHIQCGNALLGATPEALAKGIPDDAFKPIEGDDKDYCAKFKKANKDEAKLRGQVGDLFDREMKPWERLGNVPAAIANLDALPDDTPEAVRKKAEIYEKAVRSSDYLNACFLHDAWCAAFVWKKCEPEVGGFVYPITNGELTKIERNPHNCPPWMREETQRLAKQYKFFHWHLAFPEVFGTGEGGFEVMLGNPPWERPKPEPANYFAQSHSKISQARTSAIRKKLLAKLADDEPFTFSKWKDYERSVLGLVAFLTRSGCFDLSAQGKFNLGNTFVELSRRLLDPRGRGGILNVSGLATDDSGKAFIADLMRTRTLVSFLDFENKDALFASVHRSYKFSAITFSGSEKAGSNRADFVFFAHSIEDLRDPNRHIEFSVEDILLLNPISGNCPVFRERRQAELVKAIYIRTDLNKPTEKVLWKWNAEPTFLFVMSDHSDLFETREDIGLGAINCDSITPQYDGSSWLPLYESKMFHQFEHRWSSLDSDGNQTSLVEEDRQIPTSVSAPRYWMRSENAQSKLGVIQHDWLLAVREVTNATNERTSIATVLPCYPVGHNAQVFIFRSSARQATGFVANLNSHALDFVARTKVGGSHLSSFILRQLPILPESRFTAKVVETICPRVLELTFTAWDLEPFAVDCGYDGPPFRWDEDRRFQLRCELDALFFHLYLPCDDSGDWKPARIAEGAVRDETEAELAALKSHFPTPRDAVAYIMETFPIVKKKDIKATTQKDEEGNVLKKGTFRTKRRILDLYDQMLQARHSGTEWVSPLATSPASFRVSHPPRLPETKLRTKYTKDEQLWLHFLRQFLLQVRHEANLGLLVETWNLFSEPSTLITQRSESLQDEELQTWKAAAMKTVPKRGFHDFVASIHGSGLIQVNRETHHIALPEDSSLRKLDKDEWINFEISQALSILADRVDIVELLAGKTEQPEVAKILSLFAAA